MCQLGELSILSQLMGHILHGGRTVPDNVEMHYVSTATLAMSQMHRSHMTLLRQCMACPFVFGPCFTAKISMHHTLLQCIEIQHNFFVAFVREKKKLSMSRRQPILFAKNHNSISLSLSAGALNCAKTVQTKQQPTPLLLHTRYSMYLLQCEAGCVCVCVAVAVAGKPLFTKGSSSSSSSSQEKQEGQR